MTVRYSSSKVDKGSVHANGKLNGQVTKKAWTQKKQRGIFAWALSFVARIATWGAILTILFRCPNSLESCNAQSPYICKPYFRVKAAATPHVQPFLDHYAAPYVEIAKPQYETLNTHVLLPTRQYAIYYGKPLVSKGQAFARAQWAAKGQPQLVQLQTLTKEQYDRYVSPHLAEFSNNISPYYDLVHKSSVLAFHGYVLPAYEFARPYAIQGYDVAADFATTTALPASYWAWSKVGSFLDTAVWPQMQTVYADNIEPQLVRIGERLARYRTKSNTTSKESFDDSTGATLKFTASVSSSFSKPTPQSSPTSSISPSVENKKDSALSSSESAKTTVVDYWNPVQSPVLEKESDKRDSAREMVAKDLATWQKKYAAQAEEGASALEDQVEMISRAKMNENAQVTGKALLQKLEDTTAAEVVELKHRIQSIVEADGPQAEDEIISAVRSAGGVIKKTAQMIRGWREAYDAELKEAVLEAADVHFQILDETRNLALQNIGMKWAWTDGVTYHDWQKYHELKSTLNSWTEDLKKLIVTHPTLLEAQELSHQLEDDGMTMAGVAAKELSRLKEVSSWKIQAKDATDNFASEDMRLAAEAAQKLVEEPTEESTGETIAGEKQVRLGPQDSETEEIESGFIIAKDSRSQDTSTEPSSGPFVGGDDTAGQTPIIPDEPPNQRQKASTELEEDPISPDAEAGSSIELGSNPPESGDATSSLGSADISSLKDGGSASSSTATTTAVIFGAAAQSVADRSPILDPDTDLDEDSNVIASMTSAAQAAYSSATVLAAERYSSAASVISAQIHGTSDPVHVQLLSSVSSAYAGAVSAANHKMNDAIAAATSGVSNAKPTPTKAGDVLDWKKVESIAAQRLDEGRLWAEIQYQSVLIALGVATPTPTSPAEKFYEEAKFQYFAGLGMAQDRYASFMAAASSAWSSRTATSTPTPTDFAGSASSMASVAGKSAASAASVADEGINSAYSAVSEGVMSAAQDAQDAIEKVADSAAEQLVKAAGAVADTWDVVVSQISADIYGQPSAIGWYEGATKTAGSLAAAATEAAAGSVSSASDAAARQLDAVNKIISELIVGKEPTFSESVMSRLSAVYATATSSAASLASEASVVAASVGDKAGSVASQATEAVKESAQKVRDEL